MAELEKVLLDIEVNLNKRPLTYIEDDIAHQPLTPNSILLGRDVVLPTDQEVTSEDEEEVFRKQQKYVLKCKEAAWRKFHREYLVALRERHNLNHRERQCHQSNWFKISKKLSRTTDKVILPNGITLQHCQKHRDKIESKCGRV